MRSISLSLLSFVVVNNLFQFGAAQTTPACFSTCETSGVVASGCASVADVTCNCASQDFLTTTENCFTAQCDTAADAQTALQLLQNQCAAASASSSSSTSSLSSSTTGTLSTLTRTRSTSTTTNPNLLTTTTTTTSASSSTSIINTPDPNYTAPTRNIPPPGYTYTPPSQATSAAGGGNGGGAVSTPAPLTSNAGNSGRTGVQIALAVVSILVGACLV